MPESGEPAAATPSDAARQPDFRPRNISRDWLWLGAAPSSDDWRADAGKVGTPANSAMAHGYAARWNARGWDGNWQALPGNILARGVPPNGRPGD
jgi:hypothetical protein